MVSCRTRLVDKRARCFKCLAFGHSAHNCRGPSRERCCRRYGVEGHFAASCKVDDAVAVQFQKKLYSEERKGLGSNEPPTTTGQ